MKVSVGEYHVMKSCGGNSGQHEPALRQELNNFSNSNLLAHIVLNRLFLDTYNTK